MSEDVADSIETNAQKPARASGDSGSVEQHSLPDQIAAQRFLANREATSRNPLGLIFRKIKPPSATGS